MTAENKKIHVNTLKWYTRAEALKAPHFPHYKREETEIMRKFLTKFDIVERITFTVVFPIPEDIFYEFIASILEYYADIFHTPLAATPAFLTEEEVEMIAYNHALKADALADVGDSYWLIEVKDRPRPSALGQLLCYKEALHDSYWLDKPVQMVLVADYDYPHVRRIIERFGVRVIIV